MTKIKIIAKNQGEGIYKSDEKKWEYFLKIDNAEIQETDDEIKITGNDGTIMIANKNHIYANNNLFITYMINLDYGGGLQILLNKYKNENYLFELKGFYSEGFSIKFESNTGYIDNKLNDPNFNPKFTKKQFLNGQELALFFQALVKNLFAVPKKGYLLFKANNEGGGSLYFDEDYYYELKKSIYDNYSNGKFAESNAEYEWMNLKSKIDNSENVFEPSDVTEYSIYLVSK